MTGDDIQRYIVQSSLDGEDEATILGGTCTRLAEAGIPIMRAAMACDMLDPTYDAYSVRWSRHEDAVHEAYERTPTPEDDNAWKGSPLRVLVEGGGSRLRRRLADDYQAGEFAILDEFRARGATDYCAMIVRLGRAASLGEMRGMVASWMTDAPAGFTDDALDCVEGLMPALAASFLQRAVHRSTRALLATYLGDDAAARVLEGNVVRGRAETIRTVVWFSDLVGYTRIADKHGANVVLDLLNDYAGAQVEAIESHGGHVLKFIGDAILAIFRGNEAEACARALDAVVEQRRRIEAVTAARAAQGKPTTDAHVALHRGEVLYGNVGSPRRLDFTVLGAAINEAARIEAMCTSLEQPVIVSNAFREACGASGTRLVSLGRYALKGVSRPQELFTIEAPPV